jgi:hypothetical protein
VPWFPDFVGAVELARRQSRIAGRADPATQYVTALDEGDTHVLETVWPGEVVVNDPRRGEVRGRRHLRRFITENHEWFAAHGARVEKVASTSANGRAVLELVVHLRVEDGQEIHWPVAVVAESPDDLSVVFRSYCSQQPILGSHHLRPAILPPDGAQLDGLVARYLQALEAGDTDAIVGTFAPEGYYRGPASAEAVHRGAAELQSFFAKHLSGGGIRLLHCAITDDGVRCAVEYTCVRWGRQELSPQAGIGVYERHSDGLLAAVRLYDDVEPPADRA